MTERRVVLDEKTGKAPSGTGSKKKKKKSCCCSCLITAFVTIAVVLIAGVGVGWYFGDKYTKENLNMSLSECFGVVGGLYSPNEKKIVSNPYSDADLNDFYTQLKHALFLKDSVDVDVDTIYGLIQGKDAAAQTALRQAGGTTEVEAEADGGELDANALMQYISALFTKENIDFTRLGEYDETKHDEYLLKIQDKGLAAFVDKLLVMILADNQQIKDALQPLGIDNAADYIELNQIILTKQSLNVGVDNGSGQTVMEQRDVTTVKLTAHLKLSEALKAVLQRNIPNGFVASMAHFAAKALLPNDVYITAGTGLNYDTGLEIYINNIDSKEKTDKAFKLIDGIMAMTGGDSVQGMISDMMTKDVVPMLEQAGAYVDFSAVADGALKVDPFSAVIELSGINTDKQESEKLKSTEVLTVLSEVLTSDFENAILPDYTFNNQHASADTSADGYNGFYKTVYNPASVDESTLVDYKDEFLNEVSKKYLINLDPDGVPDSGDEIHFNDFMAMFGVGTSDKTLDLMKLIDGKRMTELLGEEEYAKLSVEINDRMMGAIVSETIGGILAESDFAQYGVKVEQIIMRERDVTGAGDVRQFLELGVSADVAAMTQSAGTGAVADVLKAFLPERILLSVNMDITKDLAGKTPTATEIKYNDLTADETDGILNVIGKLVPSLGIDELLKSVETPLREMLDQMYSLIGSVRFAQSKVVLPSVFKLMEELLFTQTDADGNKTAVVTGEQIKDMLHEVTGSDDEQYVTQQLGIDEAAANYDGFVNEIKDKYYINTDVTVNTFDDIFSIVNLSSFDSSSFNIEKLKADNAPASQLSPVFTDREMAHMFQEVLAQNPSLGDLAGIQGIQIRENNGDPYVKLAIEMKLSGLGEEVSSILPVTKVYVVATAYVNRVKTDASGNTYYETDVTVNKMNAEQKETLQKMLNHLQGENALDLQAQSRELGKLIYDQLNVVQSSLGADGFKFVQYEENGKTVGGIQLMSFYEFLAKATGIDTSNPDFGATHDEVIDNVKGAVQGLYERTGDNANNYDVADIVKNGVVDVDLSTAEGIAASFETMPSLSNGFTGKMADNRFGGYLQSAFQSSVGALRELTILNKNNAAAQTYRDKISAFGVSLSADKDYMLLVVAIDFSKIAGGEGSTAIGSFLPQKLYVSICVELDSMHSVMTRINGLTHAQQNVLFAIAGIDGAEFENTVSDALSIISGYSGATYTDSVTAGAVGSIETHFTIGG